MIIDLALQLVVNGIIIGSLYALGGVSWGIIYNTTLTFHYAACLIFSVAGYAAVLVATDASLPIGISFLSAILIAAFLGCVIEFAIYRPLRERGAKLFNVFLASMGTATMGLALLLLIFSANPRVINGFPKVLIEIGSVNLTSIDILIIIVCWILIGAVLAFLLKTKYGKIIRAIGVNRELAEAYGLNVNKIYLLVNAIGSGLFGVEASLFALKYTATPFMGIDPFFMAFTAVFLGGAGTILGAAFGGFILGISMQLGMVFLPGTYTYFVAFTILFVVLIFKPQGLLGARNVI